MYDTTATHCCLYNSTFQISFAGVKVWHILVTVFVALILLLLIILICVKLGFFRRRKRPEDDELVKKEATKEELQNLKEPMAMDS